MEKTLKITTGLKGMDLIFNKVIQGKELTEKQEQTLQDFLQGFEGFISEETIILEETFYTEEKPEEQPITLEAWDTLNEDQQKLLKESLLKSKYGIGGEHFSTFPTLLDNKINTWVEEKYQVSKLPKRVQEGTFNSWKANGELKIIPLLKGERVHYLITILPNKPMQLDTWELQKEDIKPYLEYTTHNLLGQLSLQPNNFHILNGYTNKNKAFNQAKHLVKLFQLGTDFQTLEAQKELQTNHLKMEIQDGKIILQEISKNTYKPTGKTFTSIGEYLGREQHKDNTFNYLENIN